jgi:hypothetical protein
MRSVRQKDTQNKGERMLLLLMDREENNIIICSGRVQKAGGPSTHFFLTPFLLASFFVARLICSFVPISTWLGGRIPRRHAGRARAQAKTMEFGCHRVLCDEKAEKEPGLGP